MFVSADLAVRYYEASASRDTWRVCWRCALGNTPRRHGAWDVTLLGTSEKFTTFVSSFYAMEPYHYSQVAEGSIRLLRLSPHSDRQSRIHCHLFEFPLTNSASICPYEALSYVWGSNDKPFHITANDSELHIGANLHVALVNLRHSDLDRVIWIDALCIDQDNTTEKAQQVQSMAKIYAKASCVIIWLGETADGSDEALWEICRAAVKTPNNKNDPTRVLSLLKRPWFQRIWVLQEVAAARHTVIKCGSTEVDGYAFCIGLNELKLSYEKCNSLQPLIVSVAYLIRGSILRPRHIGSLHGRFSLDIRPLSELVEIYHTRKATERHDKVYALLGMSSDDPIGAGLSIDYTIPWSRVFQSLIQYTLVQSVSVDTWDDKEIGVIRGKGSILAEVSTVTGDHAWEDNRTVEITWKNICAQLFRTSTWTVQASVKSIQVGDVICLFEGALRPTIIRRCGSYWSVIMISIPPGPIQHKTIMSSNDAPVDTEWLRQLQSTIVHLRDLVVVWDWGAHSVESFRNQEQAYVDLVSTELGPSGFIQTIHNLVDVAKMGLVLQDLEKHAASEDCVRRAVAIFEDAIRNTAAEELASHMDVTTDIEKVVGTFLQFQGGWLPLRWASEDGLDLVVRLILEKADPNFVDEEGRTPMSWASEKGYEKVVQLLLETGAVDPDARDRQGWTLLLWAANNGHEVIVKLLLKTQKVDPDAKDGTNDTRGTKRTPLLLASEGDHKAVVKRLLDTHKVNLDAPDESGGTPLMWAVKNGHTDVVNLLLQIGQVDLNASEHGEFEDEGGRTPLMLAANNRNEKIVKLLLQIKGVDQNVRDESSRTAISLAAANGDMAIMKLLLRTGKAEPDVPDKHGRTPLWFAAECGFEEGIRLLLDTKKVNPNSRDKRGRTPLIAAAKNGHERIVNVLAEINELGSRDIQNTLKDDRFLNIRDEHYFKIQCEQLFSHVQQWVTRFSKSSDMRTSRRIHEINHDDYDSSGILDPGFLVDRLDDLILDETDVDEYLSDRVRRRDVFTSLTMRLIWEFIFTRYLLGIDREQRQKLKSLERIVVGPVEAIRKWRAITLTLLLQRDKLEQQRDVDAEFITQVIFRIFCALLPPPDNLQIQIVSELRRVVREAVQLATEMRTQKADWMMLPPLKPYYDENGNLECYTYFNASTMNVNGTGAEVSNDELEAQRSTVRIVLFPLVIRKGDDDGVGGDEMVGFPAQVLLSSNDIGEVKRVPVEMETKEENTMKIATDTKEETIVSAPMNTREEKEMPVVVNTKEEKVVSFAMDANEEQRPLAIDTTEDTAIPASMGDTNEEQMPATIPSPDDKAMRSERTKLGWVRKILTKVK